MTSHCSLHSIEIEILWNSRSKWKFCEILCFLFSYFVAKFFNYAFCLFMGQSLWKQSIYCIWLWFMDISMCFWSLRTNFYFIFFQLKLGRVWFTMFDYCSCALNCNRFVKREFLFVYCHSSHYFRCCCCDPVNSIAVVVIQANRIAFRSTYGD